MTRVAPLPEWPAKVWSALSLHELRRLKRALEGSEGDPVDVSIYRTVVDAIWDRAAEPAEGAWPVDVTERGIRIVRFCAGKARYGEDLGPDDPSHRPVRRLPALDKTGDVVLIRTFGDMASWGDAEARYACSCGAREGDIANGINWRRWRVEGGPGGWYLSNELGELGLPANMWLVCKYVFGGDINDRRHALSNVAGLSEPSTALFYCICGHTFRAEDAQLIKERRT